MSEFMPKNDVINVQNLTESIPPAEDTQIAAAAEPMDVEKKKKRGSFGIFKAALFMLRAKPKEKEKKKSIAKQNSTASNDSWKKLVGSMRPLHMQEVTESPPPSIAPSMAQLQPQSPAASSSAGTMSQYASALSLRDLYNSSDEEEEEDPDEVFDAICGDELIDAKAEEFIAQFYKQIRIQNHHRVHNYRRIN